MSPDRQADALRKSVDRRVHAWLAWAFAALAAGLLAAALAGGHPAFYALAAIVAFMAWSMRQVAPYMVQAAQALRHGAPRPGTVSIVVTESSDSLHYEATVQAGDAAPSWRFAFVPLGWKPQPGRHAAEVFLLPGVAWPALARVEQGLIYPQSRPHLATG